MPGTLSGGKHAAQTNKERYGEDFYKRIGSIGGKKGTTGGFAGDRELARRAGRLGGLRNRRKRKTLNEALVDALVKEQQSDQAVV